MENGTVRFKDHKGRVIQAQFTNYTLVPVNSTGDLKFCHYEYVGDEATAPFNDGEYLHYTRFHPQLKDMVGTEGYFYDEQTVFMGLGRLSGVNKDGCPMNDYRAFCYFAVPVESGTAETEKTELTLQEVAAKFGVAVEQIRIKE